MRPLTAWLPLFSEQHRPSTAKPRVRTHLCQGSLTQSCEEAWSRLAPRPCWCPSSLSYDPKGDVQP